MRSHSGARDPRWIALYVLCGGMLMIVFDVTIVNVVLPSIQDDLRFSTATGRSNAAPAGARRGYKSSCACETASR